MDLVTCLFSFFTVVDEHFVASVRPSGVDRRDLLGQEARVFDSAEKAVRALAWSLETILAVVLGGAVVFVTRGGLLVQVDLF